MKNSSDPFFIGILLGVLGATIAATSAQAGDKALIDTAKSPHAKMYMPDLADVKWTGGLWGDRFEVCRTAMIPYIWSLYSDTSQSKAWMNFQVAAGVVEGGPGLTGGPAFNDGDFLKWFEAVAQMYAVTHDPQLDKLMDSIIPVIAKAQRDDGYLFTQQTIAARGGAAAKDFASPDHFVTYNMGHLMTAACVHYRATGKTTLLETARKAAAYLDNLCRRAPAELAKNGVCPSHYMGAVELYRATGDKRYLELAKRLIDIRDLQSEKGEGGADQNQDRIAFRQQTKAVGHAVRANYLYAGVADVVAETGDATLMEPLQRIADDVADRKLYITGATGAKYDAASPDGSSKNSAVQLVHQAYGRDFELPNLTAYNESCATIGYAMWTFRMLELTGDARYADLFENTMYNGVLAAIGLDGKSYFYVNPLRKLADNRWPLRWSRTRVPNIPSSFCCPPNIVRAVAEAQNYIYSLSPDTVWVHLYGASTLSTTWFTAAGAGAADAPAATANSPQKERGNRIRLHQDTDYPWSGAIKITIDEAPDRPIALKLRIPRWASADQLSLKINGQDAGAKLTPGTYAEVKRAWKANDALELKIEFTASLWEANPLVEETLNQVAVKYGPIVYCLESVDLPPGVKLEDVALSLDAKRRVFTPRREKIAGADLLTLSVLALEIPRQRQASGQLYREADTAPPRDIQIKLVPYYAWGNRGDADMSVWLPVR
ncbi:MAG: beta-L-arabinofuranosidase domain-containing protein [Thermoguttaceae bacterium]